MTYLQAFSQAVGHGARAMIARNVLAMSLVVATGMAGSAAHAQSGGASGKIQVGGTPSLLYLPFYVALEQGYFSKRGLEVELISLANTNPALVSGDVQFSLSGSDAAVISAARGRPTPAVVMLQQRSSLSLVVSSAVTLPNHAKGYPANVQDLRGKTLALNRRGSSSESLLKQIFAGAGMEEGRDYSVILISQPGSIIAALKARQIDGAILWPPYQEQAAVEKAGFLLIRENTGEGPASRSKSGGVSMQVNANFMKANPDAVKKVVEAMTEAAAFTRDYKTNANRLVEIGVKYTGMGNKEALSEAIASVVSTLAYPGIDCAAWASSAQEMFDAKSIPKVPTCDEMTASDVAPKSPTGPKA